MAVCDLKHRLGERALTLLCLACCTLMACQQDDDPGDRHTFDQTPAIDEQAAGAVPPVELLTGNCESASHVALVDARGIETVEKIHADDGTLGYVIDKVSAVLLKAYKGDFGDSLQVAYYAFLEYPTAPDSTRLDTLLVFLKQDPDKGNFLVLEAGQFRYSDSLGRIVESICSGE